MIKNNKNKPYFDHLWGYLSHFWPNMEPFYSIYLSFLYCFIYHIILFLYQPFLFSVSSLSRLDKIFPNDHSKWKGSFYRVPQEFAWEWLGLSGNWLLISLTLTCLTWLTVKQSTGNYKLGICKLEIQSRPLEGHDSRFCDNSTLGIKYNDFSLNLLIEHNEHCNNDPAFSWYL